jgi:SpoVK/Ycf46/Vps4 family AAA+-type ATPase
LTRTNLVDENLIDLIEPTKGVILYGPPGTGKTTLARNIGKIFGASGSRIKRMTATEIKSKWHGESEGNIRKLFELAIKEYELYGDNAPLHILIIDEIDAILGSRGDSCSSNIKDSIVNQFLGEMDGLVQFANCIIIGITNRLELLDQACLRPGRFGCHIHVDLPNESQRKLIFESFHKKLERAGIISDIRLFNYELISSLTQGMSGAGIKNIYQLCVSEHVNKKMDGIQYIIEPTTLRTILRSNYKVIIE